MFDRYSPVAATNRVAVLAGAEIILIKRTNLTSSDVRRRIIKDDQTVGKGCPGLTHDITALPNSISSLGQITTSPGQQPAPGAGPASPASPGRGRRRGLPGNRSQTPGKICQPRRKRTGSRVAGVVECALRLAGVMEYPGDIEDRVKVIPSSTLGPFEDHESARGATR